MAFSPGESGSYVGKGSVCGGESGIGVRSYSDSRKSGDEEAGEGVGV